MKAFVHGFGSFFRGMHFSLRNFGWWFFIPLILWFVLVGVNNKKARDTQCEIDGKKEGPDCDEYVISEMYQQNVSARQKSWAGPILVLLLFVNYTY